MEFCYVWPQDPGEPRRIVVPKNSLQMRWVESAPYFCVASETSRDIAVDYIETQVGVLQEQKFEQWAEANKAITTATKGKESPFRYLLEVYVDDFIACIIPTTKNKWNT